MKNIKFYALAAVLIILLSLSACTVSTAPSDTASPSLQLSGRIYLYGELHGVEKIIEKEFSLWNDYYHDENMRHLFVEYPYYTAEFLNIWLQSESDDILEEIYHDWSRTASHNPHTKEFLKKIKKECPETIFHGTDIGHQFNTIGERFLKYLENNNLEDSEQYLLAQEVIEQGKYFYEHDDFMYRENMMVENFIREFDSLSGENIMGIYGVAHTGNAMYYSGSVPCMSNQLEERYGDALYTEDLSWLAK